MRCARNRVAYTLVELLVYLALLAALSFLTFGFAARTYRFMLERLQAHHLVVRLLVTSDVVRRDVQCASLWPADWDAGRCTFKQLTMTADGKPLDRWVGYAVDDKGLHRYEGLGGERIGALVDAQVTGIEVRPVLNGAPLGGATMGGATVVGVNVVLRTKTNPKGQAMVVALRNRVLG